MVSDESSFPRHADSPPGKAGAPSIPQRMIKEKTSLWPRCRSPAICRSQAPGSGNGGNLAAEKGSRSLSLSKSGGKSGAPLPPDQAEVRTPAAGQRRRRVPRISVLIKLPKKGGRSRRKIARERGCPVRMKIKNVRKKEGAFSVREACPGVMPGRLPGPGAAHGKQRRCGSSPAGPRRCGPDAAF